MLITAEFLRECRACSNQLRFFEQLYPNGVEVTPENAQAALDAGLSVPWVFRFVPLTVVLRWPHGHREWYQNGRLHREEGPAIVYPDGYEAWYRDGERHREGGPAVVFPNGHREWYQNGMLHREDGPAVIYSDGSEEWYQNGIWIRPE